MICDMFQNTLPCLPLFDLFYEMAEEQKWDKFKNEVARRIGRDGAEYTDAPHEVWRIMYLLRAIRQEWS